MVTDPVCKMVLAPESAAAKADYSGNTFYFCSKHCQEKFAANPSAYAGGVAPRPGQALIPRAAGRGVLAAVLLLSFYFALLSLTSGWKFMLDQYSQYWPYITALALGFGIQVGLYAYLRAAVHGARGSGRVVAVSGTTSGAAMVSCCLHYLVNLVPVLGATGLVALVDMYQVQLFWVGLLANAAGIAYIGRRVMVFANEA